jgi:rhodanese-related sulfurtransferase
MTGWFDNIGFHAHDVYNVTPRECYELCQNGACLVDVREVYMSSFKMFMIRNVIYLPYSLLVEHYPQLPEDKPLIFADSVGLKSRESVLFLKAKGYENIANLAGGIVDWERDNLPVTTDISYRLSGTCMCQLKARERKD